jgi:hypothetical protein
MPSLFDRAGSLARGLRRKSASKRRPRQDRRLRTAIDQLESRLALAITSPLSIGGTTFGSFTDTPTGPGNIGDLISVTIQGTKGTVIFNGGAGVADGTSIQTIEIIDASPDFQMTFAAEIQTATAVPYGSDGVIELGVITTDNVIRGINTVRGPLTNVAAPWELETSAIHLYTFNDGTVSGSTVNDLIGGANGTLVNGATVSNGQLVLADISQVGPNVQYMQMPEDVLPQGSTAATFELWFTASNSSGVWGRGFDIGSGEANYVIFTPLNDNSGSRAAIKNSEALGEQLIDGTPPYNDGTQHLATVTIDDATATMVYYIDGVQIGQLSLGETNLSGIEAVNNFLGRSQFAQDAGFIGSMNQFAIYDRVLNPTEVLANFTAGPISGAITPIGFTQTTPGSGTLELVGDQTAAFPVGAYVAATPLLPTPAGAPSFGSVLTSSYDSNTNVTTLTFDNTTAAGTTAGALTLAERREPEFRLTTFVGRNFSNRGLKDGGGIFVDVVEGADYVYQGDTIENLGILLSDGLLAYSTIGIRRELAASVILGTSSKASADGRVFIESATPESIIYVGAQTAKTGKNSTFQLQGGDGEFGAFTLFAQAFNGVVNLAGAATNSFGFLKGVGSRAVLNAYGWSDVEVLGNFAGTINSVGNQLRSSSLSVNSIPIDAASDINLEVTGNVASTARINSSGNLLLVAEGSVQKGAVASSFGMTQLGIEGNLLGTVTAGTVLSADVIGNVTGARLVSGGALSATVGGGVSGSTFVSGNVNMVVGGVAVQALPFGMDVTAAGNVSKSRFIANGSQTVIPGSISDINATVEANALTLTAGRDATGVVVMADNGDALVTVGRNFSGSVQNSAGNVLLDVAGSVLKGSSFVSGDNTLVDVGRNFDGTVDAESLRFFVGGNVSKASRIVATQVFDWQNIDFLNVKEVDSGNFAIGGRLDGIVDVTYFDGYGILPTNVVQNGGVTILGNGAGSSARFYVGAFATGDTLVFNGNFNGNLRTLQDLTSNLTFNGNVSRLTFGGRIGSFEPGNTITPVNVAITVTGKLLYLNSNSFFEATTPGKSGTFWNNPSKTSSTGTLTTGSYVKVVPLLEQSVTPPTPTPVTYTAPTAPQTFSAKDTTGPDGIAVTFSAPSSDGGLPVLYYEYSTNALAGTPAWRKFDTASQGPGTDIPLTVDSAGGAWTPGGTYDVAVRAVNAVGSTATTSTPVTFPNPV